MKSQPNALIIALVIGHGTGGGGGGGDENGRGNNHFVVPREPSINQYVRKLTLTVSNIQKESYFNGRVRAASGYLPVVRGAAR